jgi:hypothetical protein
MERRQAFRSQHLDKAGEGAANPVKPSPRDGRETS